MVTFATKLRTVVLALVSVLALALTMMLPPTTASALPNEADTPGSATRQQALPLGKARFAVSVGGLSASSTSNWVRLGQYEFGADGTVTEQHWHWTQNRRDTRSYTGNRASGCPSRDCNVQTARGYESSSAPQQLNGTYTVNGTTLRIEWSTTGWWEEWELASAAGGDLATADFAGSSFGATHGFGYGSNAAWNARVAANTIAADDHTRFNHIYRLWKTTAENPNPHIDSGSGSPFWIRDWTACGSGRCLGGRSSTPTEYYVAPANTSTSHRRDTLWHWRTALADGRGEFCYTGNSHVKPMIQIVDDTGAFQGWVGVEASLNQTVPAEGRLADDIGIFKIAAF